MSGGYLVMGLLLSFLAGGLTALLLLFWMESDESN